MELHKLLEVLLQQHGLEEKEGMLGLLLLVVLMVMKLVGVGVDQHLLQQEEVQVLMD